MGDCDLYCKVFGVVGRTRKVLYKNSPFTIYLMFFSIQNYVFIRYKSINRVKDGATIPLQIGFEANRGSMTRLTS